MPIVFATTDLHGQNGKALGVLGMFRSFSKSPMYHAMSLGVRCLIIFAAACMAKKVEHRLSQGVFYPYAKQYVLKRAENGSGAFTTTVYLYY